MPGLLYANFSPGSNNIGTISRDIEKESRGGSRRFQKSPFQPVNNSCRSSPDSASPSPDVCEPSCRKVIRDLIGSSRHCGMYFATLSSNANRSSVKATAVETPPTIALAIDAVPWGFLTSQPDAYHSHTILSLRMTNSPEVCRFASASVI